MNLHTPVFENVFNKLRILHWQVYNTQKTLCNITSQDMLIMGQTISGDVTLCQVCFSMPHLEYKDSAV